MSEEAKRTDPENVPLSTSNQSFSSKKPKLTKQLSSISRFFGIVNDQQEQSNIHLKRLRRLAKNNTLKEEEVNKYLQDVSLESKDVNILFKNVQDDTPKTPDLEKGNQPSNSDFSIEKTNYQKRPSRLDSFSQNDFTKLSKNGLQMEKKESLTSTVIDSLSNIFKKGSVVNKKKQKLQNSMTSKVSFDFSSVSQAGSPTVWTPTERFIDESPGGIEFEFSKNVQEESYEMENLNKRKELIGPRFLQKNVSLLDERIPEETSFEMEIEKEPEDEANQVDMDPSALSRMTAKVRKKSSDLNLSKMNEISRPTSLEKSTKPLTNRKREIENLRAGMKSSDKRSQFSRSHGYETENDETLKIIQESSEKVDIENMNITDKQLLENQSTLLSNEVFYDDINAPEVDEYHPDLARSPPSSTILNQTPSFFRFDSAKITIAEIDSSRKKYRNDYGISYVDVGDSNIYQPKMTNLGPIDEATTSRATDRPNSTIEDGLYFWKIGDIEQTERYKRLLELQKQRNEHCDKITKKYRQKNKKRERGIGRIGNFFGRKIKKDLTPNIKQILQSETNSTTWFYYWITTIQCFVFIASMLMAFPDLIFLEKEFKGEVLDTTLTHRRVSYKEPTNVFFGPRFADLILFGAKYSPCMRKEEELWNDIEEDRRNENKTGCCISNDKTGCWQTSEANCPSVNAHWIRWDKKKKIKNVNKLENKSKSDSDLLKNRNITNFVQRKQKFRKSGAVCGQDPDYCDIPASVAPNVWPDDITQWPMCEKMHEVNLPEHMTCQVTGRPCCIQIQGRCRIATEEYCSFVKGVWHPNATLCSQVDCFQDVCGMLLINTKHPFQIYRLFTSLFLHAGLIQFILSMTMQYLLVEDFEKMIGSFRMAILYIGSGIGGNLASAIFLPFMPGAGPSASLSGVLAALCVELYLSRKLIEDVKKAYFIHSFMGVFLFICGLFPYFDNWANIFGSIFGFFITILIFPPMQMSTENIENELSNENQVNEQRTQSGYQLLSNGLSSFKARVPFFFKKRRTYISLFILIILYSLLFTIFFNNIQLNWPILNNFNCIPFTNWCDNQGHILKRFLPI